MAPPHDYIANLMQMVQHLCMRYGWQHNIAAGGKANVIVRQMDGSTQKVAIFGRKDANGQPVMVFYTAVAPSDAIKDPAELLRLNSQVNHCHFAIVKNKLVVLDTQLIMTADYE